MEGKLYDECVESVDFFITVFWDSGDSFHYIAILENNIYLVEEGIS